MCINISNKCDNDVHALIDAAVAASYASSTIAYDDVVFNDFTRWYVVTYCHHPTCWEMGTGGNSLVFFLFHILGWA